jgi:nucleotide-binding universal stress UspA family protein
LVLGEPRPPFRHVLTALDGSASAELAFEAAVRIAQRDNARLTLLVVAPELLTDARFAWATVNPAALQEDADKAAEKLLREAAGAVPESLPVTKRFRRGHPGPEIVAQAVEEGHDVVVLGARGLGRVVGMMGSVSQHVLRHAKCVVIVTHVPPEN